MRILPSLAGIAILLFWRWHEALTPWETAGYAALWLIGKGVLYVLRRSKAELAKIDNLARLEDHLQYRSLTIRFRPMQWRIPQWITRPRGWDLRLPLFRLRYRVEE